MSQAPHVAGTADFIAMNTEDDHERVQSSKSLGSGSGSAGHGFLLAEFLDLLLIGKVPSQPRHRVLESHGEAKAAKYVHS